MRVRFAVMASIVIAGCGFRSGVDTSSFAIESFVLDQASYVQGESGTATATFRNVGPSPSALPHVSFFPGGEDITFSEAATEGEIAPQDTGVITFTFQSTEEAEPRALTMTVKDATGAVIADAPAQLLRAATLQVLTLAFEAPDFTCRGIEKPAALVATVKNVGASAANLSNVRLEVGDDDAFTSEHALDGNPETIEPGTTATFHLLLQANATVPPGDDYAVNWDAELTDATTGHDRGDPSTEHEPVYLRVHVPATFELSVEEQATTISTGAPAAGPVVLDYVNTGTVPGRIDAVALIMRIADTTTSEYLIGPPSVSLPITVNPAIGGDVGWTNVSLSSGTPTLGTTSVGAVLDVEDTTCGVELQQFVPEASRGSWIVE